MNTRKPHTEPQHPETSSAPCTYCGDEPAELYPLLDARLFSENQVAENLKTPLCSRCRQELKSTKLLPEEIMELTDLPPQLSRQARYDHWGNPVLPDGRRLKGELFYKDEVQQALRESGAISLFTQYVKYPRTPHLPWSPSRDRDDEWIKDVSVFEGRSVVATLKMDGENTTMYRDHIHARSIDSRHHPSRAWVKRLHARIRHEIPEGWRICGENMYAEHSIHYTNLPSYFLVFSIWNDQNECLSWEETRQWCQLLGLETVPVLYQGLWREDPIRGLLQDRFQGDPMEGYVVRVADSFHYQAFPRRVAKCVRENHVQTDQHWMHKEVVPNELADEAEPLLD